PDGLLGFLIADVSGKGIPAALFMLAVRTLARHPAAIGARPSEVLRQLNASLAPDNRSGIFVTATCGLYEPSSGTVHLACCGHPAPLLRRASGQVEVLPVEGGVPLGMLEAAAEPAELSLAIHVGDSLVLYTDGITEAIAPDGDSQFGLERLRDVLADPCSAVPRDCAARLESALDQFTKASEPQDDQTLLILQRIA
ncbi:MAG TPA: PP2C family protein-serine/threonine phosphatase, partial [Gemmataceae bacterium]|nr:PP2C family protein-serine/threonine phosphatase [Gemmataceae bacterium]